VKNITDSAWQFHQDEHVPIQKFFNITNNCIYGANPPTSDLQQIKDQSFSHGKNKVLGKFNNIEFQLTSRLDGFQPIQSPAYITLNVQPTNASFGNKYFYTFQFELQYRPDWPADGTYIIQLQHPDRHANTCTHTHQQRNTINHIVNFFLKKNNNKLIPC